MAARKTKLIGIVEAASLFGKSVHQMRQYRSDGLLQVAEYSGNKQLYDMAEVVLLKHLLNEMRVTEGLTLAQVSTRLDQMMGRNSSGGLPRVQDSSSGGWLTSDKTAPIRA